MSASGPEGARFASEAARTHSGAQRSRAGVPPTIGSRGDHGARRISAADRRSRLHRGRGCRRMWLGRELARLCTDRVLSIDRAIIRGDDRPGVCGAIDCALLAWGRWPSRRARREPDLWCDKPSRDPDHDRLDDLRVGLDGNRAPSSYTTNLKGQQIAAYRYADTNFADYEEDHLIPLELGGAPSDPRNLWPEAYLVSLSDGRSVGAHVKDQLENKLKALVCAGSLPLAVARQEIATDWVR